jgi:hypothetical protein
VLLRFYFELGLCSLHLHTKSIALTYQLPTGVTYDFTSSSLTWVLLLQVMPYRHIGHIGIPEFAFTPAISVHMMCGTSF